jgi:hypothetical protein
MGLPGRFTWRHAKPLDTYSDPTADSVSHAQLGRKRTLTLLPKSPYIRPKMMKGDAHLCISLAHKCFIYLEFGAVYPEPHEHTVRSRPPHLLTAYSYESGDTGRDPTSLRHHSGPLSSITDDEYGESVRMYGTPPFGVQRSAKGRFCAPRPEVDA